MSLRTAAAALPSRNAAAVPVREFAFSDLDFRTLAQLAYDHAGIVLSESKRNLVYSRLSRRLRGLGLSSFQAYREYLADNTVEIEGFINSISTNHTKFFRESHHFDHLRQHVALGFAKSMAGRGGGRLRVWSAGCSSGEEPYTIAVVIKRDIAEIRRHDVRILATDIDTEVVGRAARGEFAEGALADIPAPYRGYFDSGSARQSVVARDDIRSLITFKPLNLMKPWPFSGLFDAIFCRNVMIYFDHATKMALVDRFAQQLKPGGWLYIGHSETLTGESRMLELVGRTIYRRKT
jgi:chemotaxis protein methyltransferase CheR